MQSNVNFVTDGSKVYHLAGNDWYAVEQDDDKVMLVDTDCKIGDEKLETHWSDGDWTSKEGENGEAVLDYCNNLVDTYFSGIKHVITPRTVNAGTGELENALMWPMSYEEFKEHRNIGGKIVENSDSNVWTPSSFVWTRTFSGINSFSNRYAWFVGNSGGGLYGGGGVSGLFRVAPAFNLKKSYIDHIADDGEIILQPEKASYEVSFAERDSEKYKDTLGFSFEHVYAIINECQEQIGLIYISDTDDGIFIEWLEIMQVFRGQHYLRKIFEELRTKFRYKTITFECNDKLLFKYKSIGCQLLSSDAFRGVSFMTYPIHGTC